MKIEELLLTDEENPYKWQEDGTLQIVTPAMNRAFGEGYNYCLRKLIDRGDVYIRLPKSETRLTKKIEETDNYYSAINYPAEIYPFIPLKDILKGV